TGAALRDLQPRLAGAEAALALLRRAARPAYAGQDTLATLEGPVAAAIDLCLPLPGAGLWLSGWLLDPARRLAGLAVQAPGGFAADLPPRWVRVERPDVAQGFAADPRFAGLDGVRHGFAAFLPGDAPAGREGWHLALETAEGAVGYLPLRPAPAAARDALRRAAALVDLHKPSGQAVATR
ncbi:hypothetical protein, partial [Paracraurococcus ruber]